MAARDRAGGRQSAEQRRGEIGDALRDQLHVGIMLIAAHAIGDHGGHQGFNRAEHRHGERGSKHGLQQIRAKLGKGQPGKTAGDAAEPCPNGFDRKCQNHDREGAAHQRDDIAGNAWSEPRSQNDHCQRAAG